MKSITIVEIAKEAGVSIATVSRVLNHGPVSADKKARVNEVILKYNFVPNLQARSLIIKHSNTIGVITHGISNHFHMEFIEVLEREFSKMGFFLFVCICQPINAAENERRYLLNLLSRKVDGIILHDPPVENYQSGFLRDLANQIPLVLVQSFNMSDSINTVILDHEIGMRKVMNHFFELGHKDILFIRGGVGYPFDIKERVWKEELIKMNFDIPSENLVVIAEGNSELGIVKTEQTIFNLLQNGHIPTAIFACNDIMATGALNAIRKMGLRIPEDISLIGHDNTILAASGNFTSVDLKTPSVGLASIDLLNYAISGIDKESRRLLITPNLCFRNSTSHVRS